MKNRPAEIVSQHKTIGRKELAESKGDEGDGDGVTEEMHLRMRFTGSPKCKRGTRPTEREPLLAWHSWMWQPRERAWRTGTRGGPCWSLSG